MLKAGSHSVKSGESEGQSESSGVGPRQVASMQRAVLWFLWSLEHWHQQSLLKAAAEGCHLKHFQSLQVRASNSNSPEGGP